MDKLTNDWTQWVAARSNSISYGLLAGAVAIAVLLFWGTRGRAPSGSVVDLPITLVTADRSTLACASDREFDGHRCAFSAPAKPVVEVGSSGLLAPYVTTTGEMILVAGLFEEPSVAARYAKEPPAGKQRNTLRRFTAHCRTEVLGEAHNVHVRFDPAGEWHLRASLRVGRPVRCEVREP